MRDERAITLQPTALVNEVYLRLMHRAEYSELKREHFLAVAARVMKHVIIDHARRRRTSAPIEESTGKAADHRSLQRIEHLIQITQVLDTLRKIDPLAASAAELKLFTGITAEEAAAILDVPPAKARRAWTFANAWLQAHASNP
jgi:RNA polymerase sigma factor (TIGR02999 family)